ncbi:MAG: alcohol dehydrogenase catalytic domain-containing protein [Syntrophaceticus sp.]|nr:alcohol dehydrogenase catalytic domain-containing protein [Syntrophaceticus sp.]MDD3315431.1 alcohol dehydrogenase catalytic domain-containing protein [Syntrophaceticus sp.]MDD4358954.1 alcohol dehydrogenase catalytic domain-containing protein [Syntrophaceticus sp.]MDD4782548.1 alcohol dehydrogenase catalytic domain-containing protein [Syntrophaceticus sp.]
MKGWEFTDTNIPLKLVEKPDPVAKPGFVVIEVKAAGLCHSDVAALEDPGWIGIITAHPMYMGHENAGVIIEVGEGVEGWKVGDRVGIAPISAKLSAETGRSWAVGYQCDGGYADKCAVPVDCLVPLPDGVSFMEGAAATDAGMTSYHALYKAGGAKPGMKVGIIGIGGLGQFAAGMALIDDMDLYIADVSPDARKLAEEMGIKHVYENVLDMADAGCEVIVDYAGFGTTTAGAIEAVAPGGTVVVVGMGILESLINTRSLILKQVHLVGSCGGTAEDIKDVYDYFATGKLKPQLSTITFDEVAEGLERLHRGGVKGRLVAVR